MNPPVLRSVFRLDSLPLNQTYYTAEGYLIDRPIVTSTGIFEYLNPDGSIRRELRLPEDVFDPQSLASYKGKPIIVTHDAGLITKDNVGREEVGTILSEGYRSGNDVRAEIIIHDTDTMKRAGLKALSLGYNLDLDETPGEWNGQHYDAIQRNIRINHLALVREARAGEQARLNIDSRDRKITPKGEKRMSNETSHGDGVLTPDELKTEIEKYKARRAQRLTAKKTDGETAEEKVVSAEPAVRMTKVEAGAAVPSAPAATGGSGVEEKFAEIKANRDRRDEDGDPEDMEGAKTVIAKQDEDIDALFDIIDTLLAEKDFANADCGGIPADVADNADGSCCEDGADCDTSNTDGDDGCKPAESDSAPSEEPAEGKVNADSAELIDSIVRQRIQLGMLGKQMNMDGLESMSIPEAKKAIISAVRPSVNLDGKSEAYINAVFDMAVEAIEDGTAKGTGYQKQQMFNRDSNDLPTEGTASEAARQRMINRQTKKEEK